MRSCLLCKTADLWFYDSRKGGFRLNDFNTLKKAARKSDPGLPAYKLAVIGNCATQHIATAIKGEAFLRGLSIDVFDADYDQIDAQTMDGGSELYSFAPNAVLLVMCTEKLYEGFCSTPVEKHPSFADDTIARIRMYWTLISEKLQTSILQFSFAYLNDGSMGNYALREPCSFSYQLSRLNFLLGQSAAEHKGVYLVDINAIQGRLGTSLFKDDKLYYVAKMPFSLEALPHLAEQTVNMITALRGSIKKCVIVDLDNTLWGGVIGDDGLDGIEIGELGTGHAFSEFQLYLKELKRRGIILAVCSKNNEDTAKLPFEKHPEMVLRLEDFALFVANWQDKASNIRFIQQTLNIGMDSIVFLDDNPFERGVVRSLIPDITVPELPDDPALYLSYIRSLDLFETASFSSADADRTEQYRQEADRSALVAKFTSYDEYLRALEMSAQAAPFDKFHYPRIAQLTQRSNQFNLRTVRYTESEIESVANDDNHITRYYCLHDKYGDYGLISVVIMDKREDSSLFISEWLMSCRVLKRGMEEFIVNDIIRTASQCGCTKVIGEYIPSPKNAMVADLYERMGFEKCGGYYIADVSTYKMHKTNITEESK